MSCFWQDFLRCDDPSCFAVDLVYATPQYASNINSGFDLELWSDKELTIPLSPTTAIIVHATAYPAGAISNGSCGLDTNNCNLYDWAHGHNQFADDGCGPNYDFPWGNAPRLIDAPPIPTNFMTNIADGDCSVSFDPTIDPAPAAAIPVLAYNSGTLTLNGHSGAWTILLTIETDVGTCILVCGNSFCF